MLSETQAERQGLPPMGLVPTDMQCFAMWTIEGEDENGKFDLWSVDWNKDEIARDARLDEKERVWMDKVHRQARLDSMAAHYQNQGNIDNEVSYFQPTAGL